MLPIKLTYCSFCDPETDSDSDTDEMLVDQNGVHFQVVREPARNGDGIVGNESGALSKCEKCDVKFSVGGFLHHHKLQGDSETGSRKHFYCGTCRTDFQNEAELKGHVVEGCQHVVCCKCSQEFRTVEAPELHSNQVCFQLFLPPAHVIYRANTIVRFTSPN